MFRWLRRKNKSAKSKILHLGFEDYKKPGSGGGATRTHEVNKRLVSLGFDITVLTSNYKGAEDRIDEGVKYKHIGLPIGYMGGILTYFISLPLHVFRYKADLLIEDFAAPFSSCLSPLYSRKKKIALVQWLNAKEKSKQYKLPFWIIEKIGLKLHKSYIAMSSDLSNKIKLTQSEADVTVIPNGVPKYAFNPSLGKERKDILYLGRIEIAQKGLDLLIDSFSKISHLTNANLLIAGDGEDKDKLIKLIKERGLTERVTFLGRVSGEEKFELFSKVKVVAMPSRFETFGMVAVEAFAAGAPVVAFNIDCLNEVIPYGLGKTAQQFNTSEFADSILYYLSGQNPTQDLNNEYGRRKFASQYDWDIIASSQADVYRKQVSSPIRRSFLPVVLISILAVLVRSVGLTKIYDIHIDEITYAQFAKSISSGNLPLLYDGNPFFLHPPFYYFLLSLWRDTFFTVGNIFNELYVLRTFNVFIAVLTVFAIFKLTKLVTNSNKLALLPAFVFAIDPLSIRHTSRSLMEALTQLLLLVALYFLLRNIHSEKNSKLAWILNGLMFGLAFVTKDIAITFSAILFLFLILSKNIKIRHILYMAPLVLAPYAVWLTIVTKSGNLHAFINEKSSGVSRFIGTNQTTGFNAEGTPSKVGTILDTLPIYLPSYLILAGAAPMTLALFFSKDKLTRLWSYVSISSYLLLAYTFLAGAMEEQFIYYLLIPSFITIAVYISESKKTNTRIAKLSFSKLTILLVILISIYSSAALIYIYKNSDDGWKNTITWITNELPDGSNIAVYEQGKFLLRSEDFNISSPKNENELMSQNVGYIIIPKKIVEDGYTDINNESAETILSKGRVVYSFTSRDSGDFEIVQLPYQKFSQIVVNGQVEER